MYFTIKYLAPEKYVPVIAWIDGMCTTLLAGPPLDPDPIYLCLAGSRPDLLSISPRRILASSRRPGQRESTLKCLLLTMLLLRRLAEPHRADLR